jgi:hypothetical protein
MMYGIGADGSIQRRRLPMDSQWKRIVALSTFRDTLYVLDSGAARLLAYPSGASAYEALNARTAPNLPFGNVAEMLALEQLYIRRDDGRVLRFDYQGREQSFQVQVPDSPLGAVAGLASDRRGGLYLADPANRRIVHVTGAGDLVRVLHPPSAAVCSGQIQTSGDGSTLFCFDGAGLAAAPLPH